MDGVALLVSALLGASVALFLVPSLLEFYLPLVSRWRWVMTDGLIRAGVGRIGGPLSMLLVHGVEYASSLVAGMVIGWAIASRPHLVALAFSGAMIVASAMSALLFPDEGARLHLSAVVYQALVLPIAPIGVSIGAWIRDALGPSRRSPYLRARRA